MCSDQGAPQDARPVDRGKQGLKRSGMTDGYGIPLGRVLAGANCHDSPLLAPAPDLLDGLVPLPDGITVHLDAGYDGLLDGIARTLFSAWMAYALAHGASRILWLFLTVEVAWGIVQLVPWRRNPHTNLVDDPAGPAGGHPLGAASQ
jgi:hypothetical protein